MDGNREEITKKKQMQFNNQEEETWQKIPFRIVEVSSEEEGYPVTELLNHTPFSRGWQSSRFCDYPQDIILEFPKQIRVRQIQFLSHQYKITTKIEIYISIPNINKKYKKIGYLGLDSNERSNFQARELKSVYIDYQCSQMKFSLSRCYTNLHNIYSQVGIIAINVLGEYPNKAGDYTNQNKNFDEISKDSEKLEDEMIYDPVTLKRLKNLHKAKGKAIQLEDFDEAKKIKDAIARLKSVSQQLIQLEERKKIAIKNDDFDAAKLFKHELDRLRNAIAGVNLDQINTELVNENKKNIQQNYIKPNLNILKVQNEEPEERNDNKYESIPKGKDNVKLISKKPPVEELPITQDLVMDDDDQMYQFKHKNPNPGYNLAKDNKKIVDVDEQVIKGISKDFNEIVAEKLKTDGKGGGGSGKNVADDDDIPAGEFKKAEPLVPILSFDIVKLLFSKNWRSKEEGMKMLSAELQAHPHSKILSQHGVDKILTAVVGGSAYVLTCNISQALMATMEMLKILFNKFRGSSIQGFVRQDFDNYVDQCLISLIEKVGDTNLKLKEKAENTIIEFANVSLIGNKTVFEHLISGQVKKTLLNSAKHLSGRLSLITRMISNFGLNPQDIPIDALMTYAINGFKNPQKEVRDAALELVAMIYKFIGDRVRSYFKDLRPAQVNMIEDELQKADGLNEEVNVNYRQDNEVNLPEERDIDAKMEPEKKEKKKKKKVTQEEDEDNEGKNANINNKNINNQEQSDEPNPDDTEHLCQFCGTFDPAFTSDDLAMHQFKDCPMLSSCFKCKQIVEISGLNYHFLSECKNKKEFKQCNRCKEPVSIKDYEMHTAEKACIQFKSPNVANRCPLCHSDVTPAGRVGWEVHLLQNTCPNNPRTSY